MDENQQTSGFIQEEFIPEGMTFSGITELYVSSSGYNRLLRGERYGRLHVLKTLRQEYAHSAFHETALRKEFNIAYSLEHPNICRTLGWEMVPAIGRCIIMEYIDGITLKEFMEQGKLTRPIAQKIITELCDALHYLHSRQIIHRDLKPSNIMITHNGNNVKLIDFSLSDRDDYDVLKLPAGTRYYLAPEILQPNTRVDFRADIYSLGVIIGEMAVAIHDKQLANISRHCTRRRPEKRYSSATDVAQSLLSEKYLSRRRTIIYAALFIGVLSAAAAYTGTFHKTEVNVISVPMYGNNSMGSTYRRIIADERIRLSHLDKVSQAEIKKDSIQLVSRLKSALDTEYPLPTQRTTNEYRHQWQQLMEEVAELFAK